jgi:4-hydroxyproline epimerase
MSDLKVVDSHTAGEPTRVVLTGGPDLGDGTLCERLAVFKSQHDQFRRSVILEPRGYEAMVGALLCEPDDPEFDAAILFFNNKGYLNMCGHGTIGVAATLAFLDRVSPGPLKFQTPAGAISVELHDQNRVTFTNVESFCLKTDVAIETDKFGRLTGNIAYGGNGFFVLRPPVDLVLENRDELLALASELRGPLSELDIDGLPGELDHVQFFVPDVENKQGKSFVICPGGEFDRSPCGTGTSAVLACMAMRGQLKAGQSWTQESLTGGKFTGTFQASPGVVDRIIPTITGAAYVCSVASLVQQAEDPYRYGNVISAEQ